LGIGDRNRLPSKPPRVICIATRAPQHTSAHHHHTTINPLWWLRYKTAPPLPPEIGVQPRAASTESPQQQPDARRPKPTGPHTLIRRALDTGGGAADSSWGISFACRRAMGFSKGFALTWYPALTWYSSPARPFAAPDVPLLVTGQQGSPSPACRQMSRAPDACAESSREESTRLAHSIKLGRTLCYV